MTLGARVPPGDHLVPGGKQARHPNFCISPWPSFSKRMSPDSRDGNSRLRAMPKKQGPTAAAERPGNTVADFVVHRAPRVAAG